MGHKTKWMIVLLSALVVLLSAAVTWAGAARQGAGYDLSWHVLAGGGGISQQGHYTLGGTAAEPGAGPSQEGSYELCAGFWCGPAEIEYAVYLPLVLRGYEPAETHDGEHCCPGVSSKRNW